MTDLKEAALKRIAEAEAAMSHVEPWETAARQHEAKIEELQTAHGAIRAAMSATASARGMALRALREHEGQLTAVALDTISDWAMETRRLTAVIEALTERHRLEGLREEHAKKRLTAARAENPAAATKNAYLRQLRDVLTSNAASDAAKRDALKELNRIMDNDRVRVQEYYPPGFDPKKYIRGMARDG